MSKKIERIDQLTIAESFLQIVYSDGIILLDHMGSLINNYKTRNPDILFEAVPGGVIIKNIGNNIASLKIDNTGLWCQHNKLVNIDDSPSILRPHIDNLKNDFGISSISSIGFRNYYLFETDNLARIKEIKSKLGIIPGLEYKSSSYSNEIDGVNIVLNVFILVGKDNPNIFAVKFDIDTYIKKEIKLSEYNKEFSKILSYRKENTLSIINGIL
jgi:hypothetical protein